MPSELSGPGWFRGDCHVHSAFSDGELTPAQLVDAARAIGLDFIAATDHNLAADSAAWLDNRSDDLIVILGEEVTTADGHWLVLGGDPAVRVVAHPHAPFATGTFRRDYSDFDAIEVWNGLWTSERHWNADNETALAEWARGLAASLGDGSWPVATGNSDAHGEGQIGSPHTVVRACDRSADAILRGIRSGRCWIASDAAVDLTFVASAGDRSAGIGQPLRAIGETVSMCAEVRGVPSGHVTIHTDRGVVHTADLPPDGAGTVEWRGEHIRPAFVRLEVRRPDGQMAALTNPIVVV